MNIKNQHTRKIIHMDLDAFFCAVEELNNPSLKNKAFAVGGDPKTRGVVSSCSYAARQFSVHSAMPMAQALRLCPSLIVISTNHHRYSEYSKAVMSILENYSALIEKMSIDEAFMDVSDIQLMPGDIARTIQSEIKKKIGLPTSFGVSVNKLVAKIANDYGKKQHKGISYPEQITIVNPGMEKSFLAPLSVGSLWGVGEKTQQELKKIGIHTIGDLASYDQNLLVNRFGKHGVDLFKHANGLDERPVVTSHERKSLSQEVTFTKDIESEVILRKTMLRLCEKLGSHLRHEGLSAYTIKVKYRYKDFSTYTRQITLPEPTNHDMVLLDTGWNLFLKYWNKINAIRLIGIGVSNFSSHYQQLSLWDSFDKKEMQLFKIIDSLKDKYGKDIIIRASDLSDKLSSYDIEEEI
ncbi:MAG: DNA polymerase IV [Anaerolineaceae bacterium]|nr:DNA polymerase IV [Anaerolineaceae bacterium]